SPPPAGRRRPRSSWPARSPGSSRGHQGVDGDLPARDRVRVRKVEPTGRRPLHVGEAERLLRHVRLLSHHYLPKMLEAGRVAARALRRTERQVDVTVLAAVVLVRIAVELEGLAVV